MTTTDAILGRAVHERLLALGLETPQVSNNLDTPTSVAIEQHFHAIMNALNLDMQDDSLRGTPKRIAKMFCSEIFQGLNYDNFPKCTTVSNKMGYDEVVCVRQAKVKSVCEHHFLPFIGGATIAYIPGKKVIGLSKINRIVEFFSRRPQIQERLTEQISAALIYILETSDVAVLIDAKHSCVALRGVEDENSSTVTSRLNGRFLTKPELRQEFLALART